MDVEINQDGLQKQLACQFRGFQTEWHLTWDRVYKELNKIRTEISLHTL